MCSARERVHSVMCAFNTSASVWWYSVVPASSCYINTHSAIMIWKISGSDLSLIRELPNSNNNSDNGRLTTTALLPSTRRRQRQYMLYTIKYLLVRTCARVYGYYNLIPSLMFYTTHKQCCACVQHIDIMFNTKSIFMKWAPGFFFLCASAWTRHARLATSEWNLWVSCDLYCISASVKNYKKNCLSIGFRVAATVHENATMAARGDTERRDDGPSQIQSN